jgi:hypothetical protein
MRKYLPLTNDQKLSVREAQFQLTNLKEQATIAIQQLEQDLRKTISDIGITNGIPADAKVEFQLATLEFIDQK